MSCVWYIFLSKVSNSPNPITRIIKDRSSCITKTLFMLFMGHHTTSLITSFCFLFNTVTYRSPSHANGLQVFYYKCNGSEMVFFTLRRLLPYTPSCFFFFMLQIETHSNLTVCLNQQSINLKFSYELFLKMANILISYLRWIV